jgi:hypothetical protein
MYLISVKRIPEIASVIRLDKGIYDTSDMKLSWPWRFRGLPSDLWCHVDLQVGTYISEEHAVSILREDFIPVCFPKTMACAYKSTRCYNFEDQHRQTIWIFTCRSVQFMIISRCSRRRKVCKELQHVEMFPSVINEGNGKYVKHIRSLLCKCSRVGADGSNIPTSGIMMWMPLAMLLCNLH